MIYTRIAANCVSCGLCATDCSPLAYGLMEPSGNHTNPDAPDCERCGHCYSICPHNAIAPANGVEHDPAHVLALFARRRSERSFADREVSAETVSILLSAAAQTPSGGNRRSTACVLLYRDERRERVMAAIQRFYHGLLLLARNRVARVVVGRLLGKAAGAFLRNPEYRRRFVALVEGLESGRDPLFYHAPVVMLFHTRDLMPTPEEDAVLSAYNVALVAAELGLGTCFVSMAQKAISASRATRSAIGLEPGQRILAVLAVGYPTVKRLRAVIREPIPLTRVR